MGKSLLLVEKSGFCNYIQKAFENSGFKVDLLQGNLPRVNFKNWRNRFLNIFHRVVFKNKKYLIDKQVRVFRQSLIHKSAQIQNQYDVILIFRGSTYPKKMLQNLRQKTSCMINYEYDGVNRESIQEVHSLFDANFTFDPNDLEALADLGFRGLTNFYFEENVFNKKDDIQAPAYDLFYVGVGTPERLELMDKIQKGLGNKKSIRGYLTIAEYFPERETDGIEYRHRPLPYEDAVGFVKQSRGLLDFKLAHHNGLSFRFFEAIRYGKKVITNNPTVRFYDFYHPDNILITDYNNPGEIISFLEKPYHHLPPEMISKYGFQNWMANLLQQENRIPIQLPQVTL